MIQRVQTLFLLFSILLNIVLMFYSPIFKLENTEFVILKDLEYPSMFIILSCLFSIFAVFRFKNRLLQLKLVFLSRMSIVISFSLFLLDNSEDYKLYFGSFLLILPYFMLFISAYFIKKDQELIKSVDRIR